MTKWNKEQKQLFEYLTDYVTDNATAGIIVNGGENGYYYGRGGYVSINKDDGELMELINDGGLLIDDAGLDGTYLVGSQN